MNKLFKLLAIFTSLFLLSSFSSHGQGVSVSAHVKGRTVSGTLPKPSVSHRTKGTIMIIVKVDQYGNVVEAFPGKDGTDVTDKALLSAAQSAALKTHFNRSYDTPGVVQIGEITYRFDGKGGGGEQEELITLKDLVEDESYGTFVVKGTVNKIHDYDKLVFLIEQDEYIIPVQLVKKDLGAVNRFRSLNLKKGDELTVKGRLSMIDIHFDEYKGLVDATIIDKGDGTETDEKEVGQEPERIPFQLVEQKPSFNGGDANEFSKWVNSRLVYPEIAKKNGIQGRVTLQFTIEADGRVTNVKVLRGVDNALDAEAVRVVSSSPNWKPGSSGGKAVSVTYTFPVIFQLPGN